MGFEWMVVMNSMSSAKGVVMVRLLRLGNQECRYKSKIRSEEGDTKQESEMEGDRKQKKLVSRPEHAQISEESSDGP